MNHTSAVSDAAMAAALRLPQTRATRGIGRGVVWWPLLLAGFAALLAPHMGAPMLLKVTLWITFGICALSLDFVWGRAGIFSFGQNALFGIGGYTYAVVSLNVFPDSNETLTALLAGVGVATMAAAALGYLMFFGRVGDVFLSIITLAVTLILATVMASTAGPEYQIGEAQLGGFNGMPSLPTVALPAPFGDGELGLRGLYVFTALTAGLACAGLMTLAAGRFGLLLDGVRVNELRMELLGHDPRRIKMLAFCIGGAVAGLGGGLFAAWGTFINPSVFGLTQAAMVIVWVMVGGRGSLFGAFLGVVLVQWAADASSTIASEQTPLVVGLLLIAVVFFLPAGIGPVLTAGLRRATVRVRRPRPAAALVGTAMPPRPPCRLLVDHVSKRFGGHVVLHDVSAALGEQSMHAIIGPNGAGKSTLFNLLVGQHLTDTGSIRLNGRDITRLSPYQRARAGIGIKLQTPSIFHELDLRGNLALALGASGSRLSVSAEHVLTRTGLSRLLDTPARDLSHGQQQWLEIAMVVAQHPAAILLDEPAAGMSSTEKALMIDLLHELSAEHLVVVVEHDMGFVSALRAPTMVLHEGRVFREGSFKACVSDPQVIDIYLGRSRQHA